ncbi:MAG: FAD-binding protein [Treponema sp.]|nr:FAD-binding protein [Treponema sp.]
MITEVSITISPEKEKDEKFIRQEILQALKKQGKQADSNAITLVFVKKSIDARHNSVKIVLRYKVYIGEKPDSNHDSVPEWHYANGNKKVIIIGSGPAGLFGAFTLLEHGIQPIIIERGSATGQRRRDIAAISTKGTVDEDSNYCFGEGGAGTFSDGKLYTRSNKRGDIPSILRIFSHFGADKKILTDAHPHIGTDKLPAIINAMNAKLKELGAELYFDTRCTDFITDSAENITVKGVKTKNTKTGKEKEFMADAVLLATGHSATDIYEMIARTAPDALEAKTFAVGVRVEHPRHIIDEIQYHGNRDSHLGAAEYRLTSQQDGRGVYSFCMCPGGFVVPSATGPEEIVVNGMSAAGRNSQWSNAAIVVETRPEDIPAEFTSPIAPALNGLAWRTYIERNTFKCGNGQQAPAQLMQDFIAKRVSTDLPKTSYTPGIVSRDLRECLPPQITERLASAFNYFNRSMKGFVCPEALLIASETRTSTPVRILRNKETGECTAIKNLYPAGEGSGYAGGIVSSAMDGVHECELISKMLGSKAI